METALHAGVPHDSNTCKRWESHVGGTESWSTDRLAILEIAVEHVNYAQGRESARLSLLTRVLGLYARRPEHETRRYQRDHPRSQMDIFDSDYTSLGGV